MSESTFPKPVNEVVETLADIFRHQRRREIVELLEKAHARFDAINYDNWNGGTTTWALRLEIPVPIFASLEPHLPKIEKEMCAKLSFLNRQFPNDPLGEVSVSPIIEGASVLGQRMTPSDVDVSRLWLDGVFRLFLSHVSRHKVPVSKLKDALLPYGIAAFVAHEDIEPSLQWQNEIELALRSMHALAALFTPDFHESHWTDQEVGWALGRGLLVVPVRLGVDPYGLVGKFQGVSGTLEQIEKLADSMAKTLLTNPLTHGHMRRALVNAFVQSRSNESAKLICRLLVAISDSDVTEHEKTALRTACTENPHITDAVGIREAIFRAFGEPPTPVVRNVEDIPF